MLDDRRTRIQILTSYYWIRILEAKNPGIRIRNTVLKCPYLHSNRFLWTFGADLDPPDPRIRTFHKRIRLLSWVISRMQRINFNFLIFSPYNLLSGTLSSVVKAKCGRNGPKKPKTYLYYKCFLEFNLATINGLGGSILSKSRNRCTILNTFMRKGKDPDPYLWLMDPDPGGQKICGSCGSGSGSPTLISRF